MRSTIIKSVVPKETIEQQKLVNWMTFKGIIFCAIPNGARTSITQAMKLKREGMQKGFPDLLVFTRKSIVVRPSHESSLYSIPIPYSIDTTGRGVAIEMKRQKGGVFSKEQKEWQKKLEDCGYIYIRAEGYEDAKEKLEKLGY